MLGMLSGRVYDIALPAGVVSDMPKTLGGATIGNAEITWDPDSGLHDERKEALYGVGFSFSTYAVPMGFSQLDCATPCTDTDIPHKLAACTEACTDCTTYRDGHLNKLFCCLRLGFFFATTFNSIVIPVKRRYMWGADFAHAALCCWSEVVWCRRG